MIKEVIRGVWIYNSKPKAKAAELGDMEAHTLSTGKYVFYFYGYLARSRCMHGQDVEKDMGKRKRTNGSTIWLCGWGCRLWLLQGGLSCRGNSFGLFQRPSPLLYLVLIRCIGRPCSRFALHKIEIINGFFRRALFPKVKSQRVYFFNSFFISALLQTGPDGQSEPNYDYGYDNVRSWGSMIRRKMGSWKSRKYTCPSVHQPRDEPLAATQSWHSA